MKFTLITLLLPSALAAVIPGLNTFSLSASHSAPAPIDGLGSIHWLGTGIQTIGGPLGWYQAPSTDLKLFIQYNKKEGIAFDSTKSSRTVYLRPEGADGLSEVELGNPEFEPKPELIRSTNFTVNSVTSPSGKTHELFGYKDQFLKVWSACSVEGEGWRLYFGDLNGQEPKPGCTENFSLRVSYTS